MSVSSQQLDDWLNDKEGEHLEFKEAKNNFHFEELVKYCVALANEGGGKVILSVSDRRPRQVVGSSAFDQPERTRRGLLDRIPLRIDFDEVQHPQGRVLVFHVPSRPVGMPIQYDGKCWMRDGDSLAEMSMDRLREIFAEGGHDYSADVCTGATLNDLDPAAIEDFRRRWIEKSKNAALATLSVDQLLGDAEAIVERGVSYAGLILFGTRSALGKYLAQAEVVFEYRSSDASGPAQDRREYRQGFFAIYDELWNIINLRNDKQSYQDGLFVLDIPTFSERSVREALLNAVSHRDYQLGGSIFVRQYPRRLEFVSPGGFPFGIDLNNILDRQNPRNRRIADIFMKCGLVERSGQGMNLIYEEAIKQSKAVPDFAHTDKYQVGMTLHGTVQDPDFVRFLETVGKERSVAFSTQDFLILDLIHREQELTEQYKPRLGYLLEQGVVERVGRGRGVRYFLSRSFYEFADRSGEHTRRLGLDRETNKQLLLTCLRSHPEVGCQMTELQQVLPSLSRDQIKGLLKELKRDGLVRVVGQRKAAKWFPYSVEAHNQNPKT